MQVLKVLSALRNSLMLIPGILGLIWISRLLAPYPFKFISCGIWLVLFHAAVVDWKTHLVHDTVPLAIAIMGGLYCLVTYQPLSHWGAGLALNALVMGSLYVLSRKSMGFGDVMVMAALGMFLGPFKSFYLLFHASWIGALVAIAGLLMKKVDQKQQLPFIPFIAAGYLLAISSL